MNNRTERGINSFQIKCLGLIFMTVDHIGQYICDTININPLRIIGRIAAPLFLYVTINSISHTRNKLRYALRLYIAHILICLVTLLLTTVGKNQFGNHKQFSILSTFVYVVILVCIAEKIKSSQKKYILYLLAIAIIIVPTAILFLFSRFEMLCQIFLPSILTVPYSPLFILMGICWYFTKSKAKQGFILILFSFISLAGAQLTGRLNAWIFMDFFNNTQCGMILFLPFIFLYNGKKGKSMKYFFYVYYPVHIYILMLIGQCFI